MKIGKVKDIKVPVEVVLGGTELRLEEFTTLESGSIIELDSVAGEPVDLVASGKTVAKGEVVVLGEKFGIRLTQMTDGED